jgi:hypothetical protein
MRRLLDEDPAAGLLLIGLILMASVFVAGTVT